MDEGQHQADRDPGETDRRLDVGRAENGKDQEGRHDNFNDETGQQAIMTGGTVAVAICGKARRNGIEVAGAVGHYQEHRGRENAADDLRDHVARRPSRIEFAAHHQAQRHGRIEVATRDRADRVNHSEQR